MPLSYKIKYLSLTEILQPPILIDVGLAVAAALLIVPVDMRIVPVTLVCVLIVAVDMGMVLVPLVCEPTVTLAVPLDVIPPMAIVSSCQDDRVSLISLRRVSRPVPRKSQIQHWKNGGMESVIFWLESVIKDYYVFSPNLHGAQYLNNAVKRWCMLV